MNQAPFPNKYILKAVAEADSKPCYVCYKPTAVVLLSENKGDFFYVCEMHLKDTGFCSPVASEEYIQLGEKKKAVEEELNKIQKGLEENRPYSWDRIKSNLPGFSKKEEAESKEKEKEKETEKDDSPKTLTKEQRFNEYVKANAEERKKLESIKSQIDSFRFKQYTLDKNIYKVRVQNYYKAKMRQKRTQEMHQSGFFPSVPNSRIGD